MKRKLLVLMAVLMAAVSTAWADETTTVTIDGINYNLKSGGKAEVGDNSSITGSQSIEIKGTFNYGNEDYTVEEISDGAFNFTTTNTIIQDITIPNTIKKIGANAFSNIQYFYNLYFNVVEGCEIQESSFKLENLYMNGSFFTLTLCSGVKEIPGYILYKVNLGTYTVPEGVTKLGKGAFYNCHYTTNIYLPSTLKEIGDYAFYGCNQLVPFEIPEGVTTVGSHAFEGCSRNTFNTVVLPSTVTSVGENAFKGCTNLTKLEFGSSVATIGAGVIEDCTNLKSIYVLNPTPPTVVGENNFSALDEIYVPMGSKSAYDNATFWATYSAKIKELYDPNNILVYYYTETFSEAEVGVYEAYDHTKIEGELEIPSTVEHGEKTYTVTRLRGNAFKGCTNLATVKLPSTIEYIGGEAFSGCTSLTKIYLPSAKVPELLGDGKNFNGTPNGLKVVVREEKYNDFTSANWPSSLTFEKLNSFTYKTSDGKPVAIGKEGLTGATYIYNSVDNNGNGRIDYEGTVTAIGEKAFYECSKLTALEIPNTVTAIGNTSFYKTGLTSIVIPNSVTEIGLYAFQECKSMTSVTIGDKVASIGNFAFQSCTKLTSVTIPNSVTSLGMYAFDGCNKLETVVIGNKVPSIGNYTFNGCSALTSVTIGEKVASIGYEAFSGCSILTSINIPATVNSIGEKAFFNCNSLTSFSGPYAKGEGNRCLVIGNELKAFANKECPESYAIPDDVTAIQNYAFSYAGVKTLKIPNSVTSIGSFAFFECNYLKTLIMLSSSAPTISSTNLSNTPTGMEIYVREKASGSFGENWGGKTVKLLSNIKYSTGNTGLGWTSLSGYGDAAEFIGDFYDGEKDGSKFGYLEFKGDVTKIPGSSKFKDNTNLTWIELPNTLTEIGSLAFYGCTSLETITIPENVTKIGTSAFNGCSALATVNFNAKNCTEMGTSANPVFSVYASSGSSVYNTSIKNINIGENVTNLPAYAFWGCTGVTSLDIPASVTNIGKKCFELCSQLQTVNVHRKTPPTLGTDGLHGVHTDCIIYVPLNGYLSYTGATNWSALKNHTYPMAGTLALTDAAGYEIDKNVSGCTLSYTRTVTSDNWMGVYLPFDVDVTKVGGTYATLTGVNGRVLDWTTQETGTIAACTPFIFKPTEFETGEESRNITFKVTEATLHSCNEKHPVGIDDNNFDGYKLYGTFTKKTDMASTHAYALASGNFYYTNDPTKTLKPYRIFLTVPFSNNAPVRNRINGEDVTAIEGIEAEIKYDGNAYNLNGLRVDDSYKGIVIVNGKKVLRK